MLDAKSQKAPKYRIIESDLLSMIKNGIVSVGQQIPTEISISEKYNVSRLTARRALSNLENKGYLKRTPGRGSFVKNWRQNHLSNIIPPSLRRNIAMLTVDDEATNDEDNWDVKVLRAASYEAEKLGYHVTLCGVTSEQIIQGQLPLAIREKIACAAIMDGHTSDAVTSRLIKADVPFVLTGTHVNNYNLPQITPDLEDAGYKLTHTLIELDRGPVWLVDRQTINYLPAKLLIDGYHRAIFEDINKGQIIRLNFCEPEQAFHVVEQIARTGIRHHCVITLDMKVFAVILDGIKQLGLNVEDFIFVHVGRYHKEWHESGEYMLVEFDASVIAREAVRQIVAYNEEAKPLYDKLFKLQIEKLNDNCRPFKFSWI
ncbi:MAG: GntR family transcriptional regulator [Planctomycetota bacterium]